MKQVLLIGIGILIASLAGCVESDKAVNTQKGTPLISRTPDRNRPSYGGRTLERTGPAIEVMEKHIDLGVIDKDVTEIVGDIFFYNNGTEPLDIHDVDGPCKCFIGYTGDTEVGPQQGGHLQVKFNKDKISSGKAKRMVKIKSNDPLNETVEVYFSFEVQRDVVEEKLRKLSDEVKHLRKDLKIARADISKILFAVQGKDASGDGCSHCGGKHADSKKKKPADTTVYDVDIGSSPTMGPEDAPVTIVEFSDFQCPYCIREWPKIRRLFYDYKGKVRIVFKHSPLKFHKKARPAHALAEMAKQQGGSNLFWKMHNRIIAGGPKKLEIADLRKYAEAFDLDLARFDEVMSDPNEIEKLIDADVQEARRCKVTGTPTVMINGLKLVSRTVESYKKRIDQILNEAKIN